jgi:hypothetical protein
MSVLRINTEESPNRSMQKFSRESTYDESFEVVIDRRDQWWLSLTVHESQR